MKVTCEYCESVVDADKNDTCPNCGARWRTAERQRRQSCARLRRKKKPMSARRARSSTSSNRSG